MANEEPSEKKKGRAKPHPIGREVELFLKQIDGLADTLPLTTLAIEGACDTSNRQFADFLRDHGKPTKDTDTNAVTYAVEPGDVRPLRRLAARVHKAALARELVPRSFLVSLVSQFDAFLGGLIRQLFKIKPEILNSSANTLTFSQLTSFASMDNAREYVIDKEIETVLRKSHSEQFDWLETKFGLPLREGLDAWPIFIEVTERRNLFVHSNGVVSHQYLEVCKRHGVRIDEGVGQGKTLSVTRSYFETAHSCLFELAVKLSQVLWRKITPMEIELADGNLNNTCYELVSEGRYQLARCLLDFGIETLPKHGSEQGRLAMVVNRAQAYKWMGDQEMTEKIVHGEDWSATADRFQLAQAVLLDDFESAIKIVKRIGVSDHLPKTDYREWPLFKELRKFPRFAAAFEEVFGEPLNKVTVDVNDVKQSATVVN